MRSSAPPFWYVSTSNMPSQSDGDRTGYSTGRVLASESVSKAAERSSPKSVQRSQSGR